ncbi:hypothetical protein [Phycicoccus sonneratiae]|uniref:DUF2029 domain-containing protein n=1 Tax=Phycicoccus sonneratiae TaxID=2807628 RepID=A0ABS2CKW4_9MICO|nr:hypothetical protein [Phycicoccus sonneraticus]MBM6400531.1 hypothetical protein [Phycicoccus sonneraticus]
MTTETVVFGVVVLVRFLLPLAIPRWPLPAIVACLVVDGVDQTVFQTFGFDPPGYQGYDKAMDVYYLAIAFLASMRNWTRSSAADIARFLFLYRMVGVVAFELAHWRPLLLIFPNTFEYFFIAYELVRTRWDPRRFDRRWWLLCAAAIWVVVKLPQEWWIHIAQFDLTDTLRDIPWAAPALVVLLLVVAALTWFVVIPRMPSPDHGWRFVADPAPEAMDTAAERDAWMLTHYRVWSWPTLEKVLLVGLLCVIYGQILPGLDASPLEVLAFTGTYVVLNAAIGLVLVRRIGSREGVLAAFGLRLGINVVAVVVARMVLGTGAIPLWGTLFFLTLLALLVTLHDRWAPVAAVRREEDETAPQPA